MSRPGEASPPLDRGDAFAVIGIASLAAWLFRDHLLRKLTFLGNPDRIHNNLKVLKFHVDNIAQGAGLQAWNEHELLGYDSFALPYINPNPLTYLVAAFGAENLYVTAGYVSALLLALAGIGAYFFLREVAGKCLPAAAGASLYMLASITVLKVSQNDASFLVFVLIPPLLLATRQASPDRFARSVWIQAVLLYLLMQFMFLQKAAYALLLWGAYAVFLAFAKRNRTLVVIPAIAFACAFVAALPRLAGVATAMSEYTRGSAEALAKPVGAHPLDLLRWLDGTIFGRYFGDAVWKLNGVNLSEGFLLYTAAFVPFILLLGGIRARNAPDGERRFFAWTVAVLFSVIALPWMMELVWLVFAKINFIHARILIAALLPLTALVALRLRDLQPAGAMGAAQTATGIVLAGLAVAGIEAAASASPGEVGLPIEPIKWIGEMAFPVSPANWTPVALDRAALIRVALTGLAVVMLMQLIRSDARPRIKSAAYTALVSATVMQAAVGSNFQINGMHTRGDDIPFRSGNISWVTADRFLPPAEAERAELNRKLDSTNYRSIAICDRTVAGGFCAGHLSEFWKLRFADGYYGFGAPARMAVLPWSGNLGMRDLSFGGGETPQWPLLGFLNVRGAVVNDSDLYGYGKLPPNIADVKVLENPEPVLPRAFFVHRIEPVGSAREAAARVFEGGRARDVRQTSFAESIAGPAAYYAKGHVTITGTGDRLVAEVTPANQTRFLVLNELYNPRWTAEIDGRWFRVYPVNAVMRGVVVPAGVRQVVLRYRPIASLPNSLIALIVGLLILQIALLVHRRRESVR